MVQTNFKNSESYYSKLWPGPVATGDKNCYEYRDTGSSSPFCCKPVPTLKNAMRRSDMLGSFWFSNELCNVGIFVG